MILLKKGEWDYPLTQRFVLLFTINITQFLARVA